MASDRLTSVLPSFLEWFIVLHVAAKNVEFEAVVSGRNVTGRSLVA